MKVPAVRAFYCAVLAIFSLNKAMVGQTADLQTPAGPAAIPAPAHVIVVIEENHSYSQIIGSGQGSLY